MKLEGLLTEQSFLERLFITNPGIIVTPYYDKTGRVGAQVIPNEGDPYYVDPYYDDPMTTNRHNDESIPVLIGESLLGEKNKWSVFCSIIFPRGS